jgi:tRNA nucleotidyltransferase (CCA-adding enzyme)
MALLRSGSRKIPGNMEIQLTDVENQICVLVDECCADLKATKGIDTSCRIAGGWVRDKVQGRQHAILVVDLFIGLTVIGNAKQ